MEDEKKVNPEPVEEEKEQPAKEAEPEEESDFSDEAKPVSVPEVPEEEKEPEVNLYAEPEEETPVAAEEAPAPAEPAPKVEEKEDDEKDQKKVKGSKYIYPDPELSAIEAARQNFYHVYHKFNIVKWIVTGVLLAIMLAGWIVPSVLNKQGINFNGGMYISIGTIALLIVGLIVMDVVYRRKINVQMQTYFNEYYGHQGAYFYRDFVSDLKGTVDDKLPAGFAKESGIYNDIAKVGSRAYQTFTYQHIPGFVVDCSFQKKGAKQLETLFAGKYLKFDESYTDGNLLIYCKGNKRALPPNSLKGRNLLEDSKNVVIYGDAKGKALLTKRVREALNQFDTNKTFLDLAIAINSKGVYFAMGYEDDFMVLPLEKPFNPAPSVQAHNDIAKVFGFIDALNERQH